MDYIGDYYKGLLRGILGDARSLDSGSYGGPNGSLVSSPAQRSCLL